MLKWLGLSALALVLDQASKLAITSAMQLHDSIALIPSLNLTYVHNTGASFSFLSDAGGWQRWLFAGLAIVISTSLTVWLARLQKHETLLAAAIALVLGGAIGNLIDRLAYGYVIDFVDFYIGSWHFAIFNIADAAISIGVGLMLLESFMGKENSVTQ
ncbi:MAG: signal peptidase II [Methylovulum sp.]|nr:signal peptidase II [Methylovulum sp.]